MKIVTAYKKRFNFGVKRYSIEQQLLVIADVNRKTFEVIVRRHLIAILYRIKVKRVVLL